MKWVTLGFKLLPLIVEAVSWVEKFARGKGKEKQDAAVGLVAAMLRATEAGFDRDLLDDTQIQDATRKAIDAVVALQNVLAQAKGQSPHS